MLGTEWMLQEKVPSVILSLCAGSFTHISMIESCKQKGDVFKVINDWNFVEGKKTNQRWYIFEVIAGLVLFSDYRVTRNGPDCE